MNRARIAASLLELLAGTPHTVLEHDFVHTSKDAARVRGTRLEEAAKALVLEAGGQQLFLCVVSGDRRLDLRKIKQLLGVRNVCLAHPDTVLAATGCPVGTVPPFPQLLGLTGYADAALLQQERIVFSAASHYRSIRMNSQDWLRLSACQLADIARPAGE